MTAAKLGRHVAIVVGAATLMAGAIGCSGDEIEPTTLENDPTQSSRPSAPSNPQTTPTEDSTTPTSTAKNSLEEQLYDATVAFYDAVGHAYRALDPEPIESLVAPGTRAGSGYVAAIEKLKSQGHRFELNPVLKVSDFELEPRDADPRYERATATITSSDSRIVDAQGRTVDEAESGSSHARIQFMKKGTHG